jgi:hypothetical protein
MDVKRYAVSVQWGKGMHYFKATDLVDYAAAEQLAEAQLRLALKTKQKSKMNLEPTIHIWQLKENLHSLS